jgi:hypothetical protein
VSQDSEQSIDTSSAWIRAASPSDQRRARQTSDPIVSAPYLPLGALRELLQMFGAPLPGRTIRAVFSGVSNAPLHGEQLDTPLAFETFAAVGSGLGAAGFIVYDDTACMVDVATVLSRFLYVESCGQCPPCKLGTGAITSALDDIAAGRGADASLEVLNHWLSVVADANRCFLPVEEQQVIGAMLRMFPEDFEAHLHGECTRRHRAAIPKLLDIVTIMPCSTADNHGSDPTGPTSHEVLRGKAPSWPWSDPPRRRCRAFWLEDVP